MQNLKQSQRKNAEPRIVSHTMTPLDKFYLDGTVKFPTIRKHTDEQLEEAIERAVKLIPDFYIILHGVDAYMERRRRRARLGRAISNHRDHDWWSQDDDQGRLPPFDKVEFRR